MATHVKDLSAEHKEQLRTLDAQRSVAEAGHPELTAEECEQRIVRYMIFIEDMHEQYDLDPEEVYTYDQARGSIFKEFD